MGRTVDTSKLTVKDIPTEHLHPNPWNPNAMDDRTFEATRESIATFGFIDPVTVRPHPDIEGQYQVVDGEHRWRAMQELGLTEIPAIVVDLDTPAAKKFTIIANETRGRAEKTNLATLLADLAGDYGDELITGLPYAQSELDELVALAANDWDKFDGAHTPDPDPDPSDLWHTVRARVPEAVQELWEQAKARIAEIAPLHESDEIANGQVLEALIAEYMAGPAG